MLDNAISDFIEQRVAVILRDADKVNLKDYSKISKKSAEMRTALLKMAKTSGKEQLEEMIEELAVNMYIQVGTAAEIAYRTGLKDANSIQRELFFKD